MGLFRRTRADAWPICKCQSRFSESLQPPPVRPEIIVSIQTQRTRTATGLGRAVPPFRRVPRRASSNIPSAWKRMDQALGESFYERKIWSRLPERFLRYTECMLVHASDFILRIRQAVNIFVSSDLGDFLLIIHAIERIKKLSIDIPLDNS